MGKNVLTKETRRKRKNNAALAKLAICAAALPVRARAFLSFIL